MAIRTIRCGSSSAVYNAPPAPVGRVVRPTICPGLRADTEPTRLRTRLHLGAARPTAHCFRVIAALAGGDSALVYLGATRGEVVAQARKSAAVSARVVGLLLQRWVGGLGSGRWQTLPLRKGELEVPRRRSLRRRTRGFGTAIAP
ncbi:MAG TPA: hypothetical protein VKA46_07985 [Gemmataceae bacterium]|nr:hypothetical protein [Gemmataceae bacterium]